MTDNPQHSSAASDYDAEFAQMRQTFYDRMLGDTKLLVESAADLKGSQEREVDEDFIYDLTFKAHRLAGRGGTFGYPEVSECAAALERALNEARDKARAGTAAEMSGICTHILKLASVVDAAVPPEQTAA